MNEVRIGIIGCGGMARGHMQRIASVPRLKFTAACDSFPGNLKAVVDQYGVQGFETGEALMDSGLVDAVLIATPHYFHPQYSIAALHRNLHVLTEKPVSVTAKAAAEVNAEAAKHPKLVYAAVFQFRMVPRWRKIKHLIDTGRLGELRRMHWICTDWLRTQAYYDSGSWRATWAGEGGGVLINQCPHNLDMLCWLLGTPKRVTAHLTLGKYHKIEVEDEVSAFLEFSNGATGMFVTSTGEAPGSDVLEIVGERGRITVRDNKIHFDEFDLGIDEHIKTCKASFARPAMSHIIIETPDNPNSHTSVFENFTNAILDGEDLICPAIEGLHSIELANAMIMSGLTHKSIDLPTDREGYEKLLQELIAQSKARK